MTDNQNRVPKGKPTGALTSLLACLLLGVSPASAQLVINLDQVGGESPPWDPDHSKLTAVMEYAADYWERAFPEVTDAGGNPFVVDIRYKWRNISEDIFGTFEVRDNLASTTRNVLYGASVIRFDTYEDDGSPVNWFIDETPELSEEFGPMEIESYETHTDFLSDAPAFMEVICNGDALEDGPADGNYDLVTAALHEIGHAVGLGFHNQHEARHNGYCTIDDYLVENFMCEPPGELHIAIGIDCLTGDDDPSHISYGCLMEPCAIIGCRNLPAALDLLAVAAANDWNSSEVNLPRKQMAAGCEEDHAHLYWYGLPRRWFGDRVPDRVSDAIIIQPEIDTVTLNGNARTKDLHLGVSEIIPEGVDPAIVMYTGAFNMDSRDITVDHYAATLVVGGFASESTVTSRTLSVIDAGNVHVDTNGVLQCEDAITDYSGRIQLTGLLTADTINCDSGGDLYLTGGEAECPRIDIALGSSIYGRGFVRGVTQVLNNNGSISAENGDLEFHGSGVFDLDGDRDIGSIIAENGSILFDGRIKDPFDRWIVIGDSVAFTQPFILGPEGGFSFLQGWTEEGPALLGPSKVLIESGGEIRALNGPVRIQPQVTFSYGSTVDLGEVDATFLALEARTTYDGGYIYGVGTVHQIGDVVVSGTAHIASTFFDWDGDDWEYFPGESGADHATLIGVDGWLVIDSEILGGYDGTATISGVLTVNEPWTLYGSMVLAGGNAAVHGAPMTNYGVVEGNGDIYTEFINYGVCYRENITFHRSVSGPGEFVPPL